MSQRATSGLSLGFATLILVSLACPTQSANDAAPLQRIRTLLGGEYWGFELTPDYVDYLAQVRPDVIHAGVLGPELASIIVAPDRLKAITPLAPGGWTNLEQYHARWPAFLEKIHALGIRAQTTFSMVNIWGDHEQTTGFFKYYRDQWEERMLGPRPAVDLTTLLERNHAGHFIRDGQPGWYRYGGCVNNPRWRALLKEMVRVGVHTGFDGFMVQFPHARGPCACDFCQHAFRSFLKSRYSTEVLFQRFGIRDLEHHVFDATGPRRGMPGLIDLEARQFGAECVKDCFDEVFVRHGRSLKAGLVVSMWTHFREFLHADVMSQETMTNTDFASWMDERALLSRDRWGRDEDYLWYSSPVYQTKLAKGLLGDNTLDYKYLRAMAGAQPFHVLKYEYFRWRLTVGEALAHGGIAFGAWKGGWSGGKDRDAPHLKTYFQFIRDHGALLFPRQSFADVAVLYPRTAAYAGDVRFFEPVRRLGAGLMAAHILFDFLLDDQLNAESMARYAMIVLPTSDYLSADQERMLDRFAGGGGKVVSVPRTGPGPDPESRSRVLLSSDLSNKEALGSVLRDLGGARFSRFEAPWHVQVQADRQTHPQRLLVHLINYNRNESESGKELPIPAKSVPMNLHLPPDRRARCVQFLTPESPQAQNVTFQQNGDRLDLRSPSFLVYGLVVIELD